MNKYTFLGNAGIQTIERMYILYQKDPDSVDETWRNFFSGFEFALSNYAGHDLKPEIFDKEFKVINLIDAYRKRGHLFTQTNPVRMRRKYFPTLDLENYGLSDDDLDTEFHAGKEIGIGTASLRQIEDHLKTTYCQSIGAEFMYIRSPQKVSWLKQKMESSRNSPDYSPEDKKEMYNHLKQAVGFENFIHKKFVAQKRFSLEGTETLIPSLHAVMNRGAELGIEEFIIGMSHRGRLNVLANVLRKPYENIFTEFLGNEYEESIALGDVKYHLGFGNDVKTAGGKQVKLNLAPNPSHLEAVGPVIEGIARAKIDRKYNGDFKKLAPIIIHGDAAIAAQGVVYEILQMVDLKGYKTGGTIHLVVNNQVGFTTNYLDGRSSTYCTDIAKVTKSPVFHVNGDDVEALVFTIQMAMEYRQEFHSDVFIDILSYRKYGHNEGDEPRFTQPLLYNAIAKHPNPRDIYSRKLIEQGLFSEDVIREIESDFDKILEDKLELAKKDRRVEIKQFLKEDWTGFKYPEKTDFLKIPDTSVDEKFLLDIARIITTLPKDKPFFRKNLKLVEERKKMVSGDRLDWAMAELLAYGTLLKEGHPVRVSGQDTVRGTFSHRHAAHIIEDSDEQYIPLEHVDKNQAHFSVYNSPLSEYGVLGFEYGYALATPGGLTIWEAQFGDFYNVAQVIIDQYLSSAEEKWGLMNGLVLLLPHGFEGQGPEHSSARVERFLTLSGNNNMQLVNCTTPANFFHVLRGQLKKDFRVPLVVFTPKSLLRHPKCVSSKDEFTKGRFQPVIDDADVDINEVRRVVFCSGKIYYDLLEKKEEFAARDIALVRIEQLYPIPREEMKSVIHKYKNALLHLWVQEEPENMGPWMFYHYNFREVEMIPVTRLPSGSPAVGLYNLHKIGQDEIIDKVFRRCDCWLNNKYCGLQCVVGKSRKEILKQHKYLNKITTI
ncbi:MAG: 2-oxoglutarate dehydrogenase E1 component [Bacteroidales bacterium]